ncbi:MAG TPA: FtsX-like permease family protein [Blastocatellia bacterium]|jgi:putative ABC transport system permease protein|nr:FtsX-like permease family protein [Blastocatellia bacterium]
MRAYLKLFRQFILRALAREKMRSVVTALGISLGVGVTIAIRLANASALESFRAATESMAGETSVQITGTAGRFDELLLRDLGWLRDYGEVSPVVFGYAMTDRAAGAGNGEASGPGDEASLPAPRGEFVQVLGVDVLRDRALRRYRVIRFNESDAEPTAREFLLLLAAPDSIILTESFARRHDLSIGSPVTLIIGDGRRSFIVRALLLDEGPARALQGNFALMDIAAAQLALNRLGLLDRVDLKLRRGLSLEQAESEIAGRLPAGLMVTRPEAGYSQVEKMIAAFHFNLNALGSIALLVGLFLIYNTVSISVITRREEVGTLRAVGVSRVMVLALFLGEALLFTVIGTVAGVALGRLMAGAAVRGTATTVETFYIASAATETVARHKLGLWEIGLAFGVALPLALIAAALPALEASRVRPVEAMRGAERLAKSFRPSRKYLAASMALLAAGYFLTRLGPVNGLPLFGYLAALALMFCGAFLAPNVLWLVSGAGGRVIARAFRAFRVEARLASANLRSSIPRISISVAALAVSLAMMTAISIMVGSFRETVTYWVDETMVADIYARPVMHTSTSFEGEIAQEAIAAIGGDPQVAAVYPFSTRQVIYQGEPVTVGAGDFNTFLKYGRWLFKSPGDARGAIQNAIGRDEVIVNESFALRYGKQVGDKAELPTASGQREFQIIAIYYDYSNSRGWAVMDQSTYAIHYPNARPTTMSIYLQAGADAAQVNDRLTRAVGSRYQMLFTTNGVIRREVMRIFDSTFAITYALEFIAITVAGLGVISTLITLILERRGEIAVLSYLGATRGQVRGMVVIEALLIGAVSQAIGIITGLMLSLVLIYVINVQSFGWTIQFHLPVGFLIQSTLLILAVTAVAGLYPAARAAKVKAVRFARAE